MKFNIFRNINGNFDLARIVGLKASWSIRRRSSGTP
jgi:hypothetical protein